ncbi:kinase-like domain-containing protein [Lyophyllum atratum]|nr:kinase-like domain-containing protein [Lyophyllum atratum]
MQVYTGVVRIARNVFRLTKTTVVKRGPPWQLDLEAQATRYVALHTSIPVPAVYDFWTGDDGQGYLVLEYKDGEVLQRRWRHLSVDQKMSVIHTLARYVEELRALPQPHSQGWIGSVSGGAVFDFDIAGESACGPFPDEHAYNDWRLSSSWGVNHPPTKERLQELRGTMQDNHRITFTHGDIARYNILVSVEGEAKHDVCITALLDWEQAGWRPEFWEAHKFVAGAGEGDWRELGRREVVPGYVAELKRENELIYMVGRP